MSSDGAQPLLLHSLAEFAPLIEPVLDAVAPRRIVEIGGEGGQLTRLLVDWAQARDATVTCVDPVPAPALQALADEGGVQLVDEKSPDALAGLEPFDLYVVDGDHNHHVVSGELAAIFADPGRTPIALMHDVAWPAARRDQYYDPSDVPAQHRKPCDYDAGAVPGVSRLVPDQGFYGRGAFAYAEEEGGPANGVLTAVEDLLATRDDLELRRVPCVFGFAAVYGRDASWADAVRATLDPFHEHPLLARLEENRLALYLEVIDRRSTIDHLERARRDALAGLQGEVERLTAEVARLRLGHAGDRPA